MSRNKPTKILITVPFSDDLQESLKKVSPHLDITTQAISNPQDISDEVWGQIEVLYTRYVLPTPVQAPRLRWIQFHYAGVDHSLDSPLLQKPDVVATSLSGAAAPQVAEHVLTMMLALGHHLPEILELQRQTSWSHEQWQDSSPQELNDSTVGIVGYGSIGRRLAQLLHTFGATVLATKRDAMRLEYSGYRDEFFGDHNGDLVHRLYPPQAIRTML
jgi:phosphoglycerate dehydrogenase-like enzyme